MSDIVVIHLLDKTNIIFDIAFVTAVAGRSTVIDGRFENAVNKQRNLLIKGARKL